MTLTDAKINTVYKISEVKGTALKRRLLDMGFTPDSRIKAMGLAPLGGTVLVNIRGILIALRKNATDSILVEEIK